MSNIWVQRILIHYQIEGSFEIDLDVFVVYIFNIAKIVCEFKASFYHHFPTNFSPHHSHFHFDSPISY